MTDKSSKSENEIGIPRHPMNDEQIRYFINAAIANLELLCNRLDNDINSDYASKGTFRRFAEKMIVLAKESNGSVTAKFNSITLTATEYSVVEGIYLDYEKKVDEL